jgi:GNAT superfamily N-acetyltransferase
MAIVIDHAVSKADIDAVKTLFQTYAQWLPIDLEFQGLEDEFANFPTSYEFLLLAKNMDEPIGAVGLKKHSNDICEMKRLFVDPNTQRFGVGEALSLRLIAEAKKYGFKKMLLDSLRRLKPAVALYRKLGFVEIQPYNYNPEDDVIYMELPF